MDVIYAEHILELTRPYTKDDLSTAYRKSVLKNHPDVGGAPEKMVEVNAAKEVLEEHLKKCGGKVADDGSPTTKESVHTIWETTVPAYDDITDIEVQSASGKKVPEKDERGDAEKKVDEWIEAIDNRSPFYVGKKKYSFAPIWMSFLARVIVFIAGLVAIGAYANAKVLYSMGDVLGILFELASLLVADVLLCGYISRKILRVFRIFVRRKDAYRFCESKINTLL